MRILGRIYAHYGIVSAVYADNTYSSVILTLCISIIPDGIISGCELIQLELKIMGSM